MIEDLLALRWQQSVGALFECVIEVIPRTKKNSSRVMRFGKFNKIMPSKQFIAFQNDAVPQLESAMLGRPPITCDVNASVVFWRDALRGDPVNFYEAIADVLERARIIVDDKQILTWTGSRVAKDAARPRLHVVLTKAYP